MCCDISFGDGPHHAHRRYRATELCASAIRVRNVRLPFTTEREVMGTVDACLSSWKYAPSMITAVWPLSLSKRMLPILLRVWS